MHRTSFTKIAKPKTASPTLKVIKINIILTIEILLITTLIIKILSMENISKIKSIEIKWFFLFANLIISIRAHKIKATSLLKNTNLKEIRTLLVEKKNNFL